MATIQQEDRDGGVRVLTLARPPANALDETLLAELGAALDAARTDDAVRALVLTGAGTFFSGGFDLAAPRRDDDGARRSARSTATRT
jgi:enoyl-CoA hydratase/carnithine racemase